MEGNAGRGGRWVPDPPLDIKHREAPDAGGADGMPYSSTGSPLPFPSPGAPGGGLAGAAVVRSVPPPHWIPPPNAGAFNIEANWNAFNVGNTPMVIPGSGFVLPADQVGVIRSLSLNVNILLATSLLVWQLRVNGVPLQAWNALTIFPRAVASASVTWGGNECFIPISEGGAIDAQIVVGVGDGSTYQLGIAYSGWFYDKTLAEAFEAIYRP